jgi:hypothetical protein
MAKRRITHRKIQIYMEVREAMLAEAGRLGADSHSGGAHAAQFDPDLQHQALMALIDAAAVAERERFHRRRRVRS